MHHGSWHASFPSRVVCQPDVCYEINNSGTTRTVENTKRLDRRRAPTADVDRLELACAGTLQAQHHTTEKPRTVHPARSGSARANAPSHIFRRERQSKRRSKSFARLRRALLFDDLRAEEHERVWRRLQDEYDGRMRASPRRCHRASELAPSCAEGSRGGGV